jgi:hypothetical protein
MKLVALSVWPGVYAVLLMDFHLTCHGWEQE